MNGTLPNSPFATRFSGREGETRLRVTNIVRGQHRRPAAVVLVLALVAILSCGWVFSFQAHSRELTVVMETQYYDDQGNYIEIPAAATVGGGEAPGAAELNQALDSLRTQYRPVLSGTLSGGAALDNRCLLYLTQTGRYYNFLFYRDEFRTDLTCGHVTALVYDRQKDALVTLEDALALAVQTEDGLCRALAEQYDPQLKQEAPDADLCIQNQQVEGFRMGADGKVLFYLTARTDDRDDSVQDAVSGGEHLYIWSKGSFTLYDEEQPLVPEEECAAFDPPLYWQWRQEGRPQGGFTPVNWSDQAQQLMELTAQDFDLLYGYEITVPLRITQGSRTLLLARMEGAPHTAGLDDLAIGVWDSGSGGFVGDTYFLFGDDTRFITWTEDGADYLLCANNTIWQGYESDSALYLLKFENGQLQPIRNLPDIAKTCAAVDWNTEEAQAMLQPLEDSSAASRFWQNRKAIPVGNGFDLYERDPDWDITRQAEGEQWLYVGHVPLTEGSVQQTAPTTGETTEGLTSAERTLIRDYYAASYDPVYLPGEDGTWTSEQNGLRLTSIQYMGSTPLYETEGVVFQVVKQTQHDGQPDNDHPNYLVFQRDTAGTYSGALGECPAYSLRPGRAALTPEQAALQAAYHLDDLEVSLWRDGYPGGVGPGTALAFSCLDTGHMETAPQPDMEPVYQPGDSWYRADGQMTTGSFTALCYRSTGDDTDAIRTLRTDMTDFSTYRGVRVGDSRAQVQTLYPEIHSGDFWGLYPGEDYLWYSAWDGDPAYGPAILFFFDKQDTVTAIELLNMTD